jgi:parvulin-like peptidyl-prolyl isomerase
VLSGRVVGSLILLALASGCSSVSSADVVASVDDAELSRDTFAELVNARLAATGQAADPDDPASAMVNAPLAQAITGQFITLELVRRDLAAHGIEAPDVDSTLPPLEQFDAEYQALGQAWVATPDSEIASPALQAWYEQGPQESGLACVQHILVEERAEAEAALARLDAGESFDDVASELSTDAQTATQAGALGCYPLADFEANFVPEFVEGASDITLGVPSEPVQTEFGYHIIRLTPFDELGGNDMLFMRLMALGEWHDVTTDPEIGVWSFPNVVPLG